VCSDHVDWQNGPKVFLSFLKQKADTRTFFAMMTATHKWELFVSDTESCQKVKAMCLSVPNVPVKIHEILTQRDRQSMPPHIVSVPVLADNAKRELFVKSDLLSVLTSIVNATRQNNKQQQQAQQQQHGTEAPSQLRAGKGKKLGTVPGMSASNPDDFEDNQDNKVTDADMDEIMRERQEFMASIPKPVDQEQR
jgi:hypothetical protein